MATISVTIIGLGRLGGSVAMALKRHNDSKDSHDKFTITGADTRPEVEQSAQKRGLAEKIFRNPFEAVREKDIVIIAMPYSEVQALYQGVGSIMRPGTVVMDMSPLKLPSLEWAGKYLSKENYLVGITPITNPRYFFDALDDTDNASADFFDRGSMLILPSAHCAKEAVELASDFSRILGATPHFVDPYEHDGLIAATEGLPALLGLAAFYLMSNSPGWDDMQRATNANFGWLTHHLRDLHPDDLRDLLLNNRQNVVRYLDAMMEVLTNLRSILNDNDRAALESAAISSAEQYQQWINRRYSGRWDESNSSADRPAPGEMLLTGMMGGFLARRLTGQKRPGDER